MKMVLMVAAGGEGWRIDAMSNGLSRKNHCRVEENSE